jgi:predicted HTH transcriptional regulator
MASLCGWVPLFVSIFSDRLEIQSPGMFPFGMTLENFKAGVSRIRNRVICRVLHEMGLMEEWGSGYQRIVSACKKGGCPEPEWQELGSCVRVIFSPHPDIPVDEPVDEPVNERQKWFLTQLRQRFPVKAENIMQRCPEPLFEETGFVTATFFPNPEVRAQAGAQPAGATEQVGTKSALSRHQVEILEKCQEERVLLELMAVVGRSDRTKFRHQVLNPLIDAGLIEMTIPDKPRSPKQRYQTTEAGRSVLENSDKESQS